MVCLDIVQRLLDFFYFFYLKLITFVFQAWPVLPVSESGRRWRCWCWKTFISTYRAGLKYAAFDDEITLHHFPQCLQIQDDMQDMFAFSDEEMPPPPSRVSIELPERLKIFWRLKSNCTNWCFVCRLWRQRIRLHLDHMASAQGDCHRVLLNNADSAHSTQCFISKFKIQLHMCFLTMYFKISSIGRLWERNFWQGYIF